MHDKKTVTLKETNTLLSIPIYTNLYLIMSAIISYYCISRAPIYRYYDFVEIHTQIYQLLLLFQSIAGITRLKFYSGVKL